MIDIGFRVERAREKEFVGTVSAREDIVTPLAVEPILAGPADKPVVAVVADDVFLADILHLDLDGLVDRVPEKIR